MRRLNEPEFLGWAASKGLRIDPRYPHSAVLTFGDPSEASRFWEVPPEPYRRPRFILALVTLLGDWRSCYVWKHLGSWPASADPARSDDIIEFQILKGLGLPLGTRDVVEFSREESNELITLIFSTLLFAASVAQDLYIVPDHGRAVLKTDHHDVVHVESRDSVEMDRWIQGMAASGFALPNEPPDETFKVPDWMKRR